MRLNKRIYSSRLCECLLVVAEKLIFKKFKTKEKPTIYDGFSSLAARNVVNSTTLKVISSLSWLFNFSSFVFLLPLRSRPSVLRLSRLWREYVCLSTVVGITHEIRMLTFSVYKYHVYYAIPIVCWCVGVL